MRQLARIAAALLSIAIAGCQKPSDLVPVTGQITYGGAEWPNAGVIYFVPKSAEAQHRARPGIAAFNKDGRFSATTGTQTGLTPGTYAIQIDCYEEMPTPLNIDGKSWIERAYRAGPSKNFLLEVPAPPGSPVKLEFDVPRRL